MERECNSTRILNEHDYEKRGFGKTKVCIYEIKFMRAMSEVSVQPSGDVYSL